MRLEHLQGLKGQINIGLGTRGRGTCMQNPGFHLYMPNQKSGIWGTWTPENPFYLNLSCFRAIIYLRFAE